MWRLLAALTSTVILALYLLLASRSPQFTFLSPRGGVVTLAISLLIANAGIGSSQQPHRDVSMRFQLLFAGWLWLLVQLGAMTYLLVQS